MGERVTAILPCNDLDFAEAFFARLGFAREAGGSPDYRMLADGRGGFVHLVAAVPGWLESARSPFGLYLYRKDVDELAGRFRDEILGAQDPADKPWGMYEFAVNGPDGTLVRIGWPVRLR